MSTILIGGWGVHGDEPVRLLFLGGAGRASEDAYRRVLGAFESAGFAAEYTEAVDALRPDRLAEVDCLLIYRDEGALSESATAALDNWVRSGRGFLGVQCGSGAFAGGERYAALLGGRVERRGAVQAQKTVVVDAQHPAMLGARGFSAEEETYVHGPLADDARVLAVRDDGRRYEPCTWVRRHGRGRVYATALGGRAPTWSNAAFQKQLVQGVRWAAGRTDDSAPLARDDQGKPLPQSPEESMRRMHLPEGFRVELFASEPDVVKPIATTFDRRGRLWVAESVDYPNRVVGPGEGRDRIKICEDTDGDGRADKFTIFAEGLNIPTSLEFSPEGLLVAEAPHIWLMRDEDGDDVCDQKRILFTGFHRPDTHAVHSNFHYGLDNWVYAAIGYSGAEARVGGRVEKFGAGIFRFRPDGSDLEFLTSTGSNTWGLGFNDAGHVFLSKANEDHSVQMALPNRLFESVRGWSGRGSGRIAVYRDFHAICEDVRQVDYFGGYTAAAGHSLYTARDFPERYWDRTAFVCEPTGHLIHIVLLSTEGSAYVANDGYNLMGSEDPWCAPIEARVGPDGAVWWVDWYNYIVRHNPTPAGFQTGKGNAYITPERDTTHGRIYRIVHESMKPASPPPEDPGSVEGWISELSHPNRLRRIAAQRVLVVGDPREVGERLWRLIAEKPESIGAAHALWIAAHGSSPPAGVDEASLRAAFDSPNPAVREAAVRAFPDHPGVAALCVDADPHVRLAALQSAVERLRRLEGTGEESARVRREFAGFAVTVFMDSTLALDRWLPAAATALAAHTAKEFLPIAARESSATPALVEAARVAAEHAVRGDVAEAASVLLGAASEGSPEVSEAIVAGVAAGWPRGRAPEVDEALQAAMERLLERLPEAGRLQVVALARQWKLGAGFDAALAQIKASLVEILEDSESDVESRGDAARRLLALEPSDEDAVKVVAVVDARSPQALAETALEALRESRSAEVSKHILAKWGRLTPKLRRAALQTLLSRPTWAASLVDALESGVVDRADLSVDLVHWLTSYPQAQVAERATKLLVHEKETASGVADERIASFLPIAQQVGDAARGRVVYLEHCAKCHRFQNEGVSVGPDLTGVAVRPKEEILTDILDPNRSVEGNFRSYTVLTNEGAVWTGLIVGETKTTLDLVDPEGRRRTIAREDVDAIQSSGKSLMPEGFDKLSAGDLASLLEFLTQRGAYLPIPIARAATKSSVLGMFNDEGAVEERLVFEDWGVHEVDGVPFHLVDPGNGQTPNAIVLHSPLGAGTRSLPTGVRLACNSAAKRIHVLGGVSGWGHPHGDLGTTSMVVRLHYADGAREDHALRNGVHLADYIREVDVPGSKLAFRLGGRQVRVLSVAPARSEIIREIELIKGPDRTAPVVLALTLERP